MTIPEEFTSSNYPDVLDTNQNLFEVHDALRVVLAEDYDPTSNPDSIVVSGDTSLFPDTGIITLTEQYSEAESRAISFFYFSRTDTTFDGLAPLPEFDNSVIRPKQITNVTQNVMAEHHDNIKNSIIAIEGFVGVRDTTNTAPFGETMEGRINFLRKLVLSPRAWFSSDRTIGLVPLTVTFLNESFRLGEGNVTFTWNFGDSASTIPISLLSSIVVEDTVPISQVDVNVIDADGKTVQKTFSTPGNYTVRLDVENEFGIDSIVFENFINARIGAPSEAILQFDNSADQIVTSGDPLIGPFETTPKIRSKTNRYVNISIPEGIHPTTLRTYAGEEVEGDTPIDPVDTYTWSLSDDLTHSNQNSARGAWSIGGLYDIILRCDTRFGAYRITTYPNAINIIEDRNLWLFTFSDDTTVYANEFGLISETFKSGTVPYDVSRDSSFLNGTNNEDQAIAEFNRNVEMSINGANSSGNHGAAIIVYAGGGEEDSALSEQEVRFVEFDGFSGSISDNPLELFRPWNWMYLPFENKSYFLFGPEETATAFDNLANPIKDIFDLDGTFILETPVELEDDNFLNGANELLEHITSGFNEDGEPDNGRFAVYRSTVKGSTGYFLRNDGVGTFFKLRQFYRTEGTTISPVNNIRKLADLNAIKTEGRLVALNNGVFFFNNSGNVAAYNTVDGVWEIGNSAAPFSNFQDKTVSDYDNTNNSLLAASDQERIAYLSYDYSSSAFIKYNSVSRTFSALGQRPSGDQWLCGIY